VVPLDNNPAERALVGVVLGRKKHYGSRSQRGAQASALFYSLLADSIPWRFYVRLGALIPPGK
jgi:hypothetical protein